MGHEVNFDVGRGRIGFAESHCDYSRYVEERDAKQMQAQHKEKEKDESVSRVAQTNSVNEEGKNSNNEVSDLAASGWTRS